LGYIWPKLDSDSSFARLSAIDIARIRPENFAHYSIFGWFSDSIDLLNILKLDTILGEESTMNNEDFFVDTMGNWHIAEERSKEIIDFNIILVSNLSFKAIEFIKAFCFMISSVHEELFRVTYLP